MSLTFTCNDHAFCENISEARRGVTGCLLTCLALGKTSPIYYSKVVLFARLLFLPVFGNG